MRVYLGDNRLSCRNCGREYTPDKLDRRLWCPQCRAVVVRRSGVVARLVAFLTALGLGIWIYSLVGPAPRFLIVYIFMVVAAYYFVYKLTRRVAFEVIRARGVPPPEEENG